MYMEYFWVLALHFFRLLLCTPTSALLSRRKKYFGLALD